MQRMVLTNECIYFSYLNCSEEIDRIPLAGIDDVREIQTANIDGEASASRQYYCLHIATQASGYNSGRGYSLRTSSKKVFDDILPALIKSTRSAKKKAETQSRFRKAQLYIREIYQHALCQGFFALLIIAVSVAHRVDPGRITLLTPIFRRASSARSWRQNSPTA